MARWSFLPAAPFGTLPLPLGFIDDDSIERRPARSRRHALSNLGVRGGSPSTHPSAEPCQPIKSVVHALHILARSLTEISFAFLGNYLRHDQLSPAVVQVVSQGGSSLRRKSRFANERAAVEYQNFACCELWHLVVHVKCSDHSS